MYLSPTIQASHEAKVQRMIAATGCSRDVAISYLFAEEWYVPDAIVSYEGDIKYPYQPAA